MILTDATGTFTFTDIVAVFEPSTVVAVIVTVPVERAVTRPDGDTLAVIAFELDHVTVVFVAFEGRTVALA